MEEFNDVEDYLNEHENKELLRFITCGSVDDGKSTLIGRLLYDSKVVFDDQLSQAKNESKKYGTTDKEVDLALLVDGLQSEREQGITIDVAYRFFYTKTKKYIIADTPGHEQYTRNMVTGASTSDLAIILIDARKGILTQTRRHSFIVGLLGIKNIVVAVNKMDLMEYSKGVFENIRKDYLKMNEKLKLSLPYKNFSQTIEFIPVSALKGDNIINKGDRLSWFKGKTLMELLDSMKAKTDELLDNALFRYPVQYVNRPNLDFRGFCGLIASGEIKQGDGIVVYPAKSKSKVKEIIQPTNFEMTEDATKEASIEAAYSGMAVTLTLEDEIDISRGDLIVRDGDIEPIVSDAFEAMVVWMDESEMKADDRFDIKIYSKELACRIDKIFFKKNINTWEKISTNSLELNDIARCKISLDSEIPFDMYEENEKTGSFILIDRMTNNSVAAGMIVSKSTKTKTLTKEYMETEKALNKYVREFFPEWECKAI